MKNLYMFFFTAIPVIAWGAGLRGQSVPRQGEILITEIMANPDAVSDTNGEWFEVWNPTERDLLMNGLILKDAGSNQHAINSADVLILPSKAYWILARNGDSLTNGGIRADYVYQNFTLGNTSDQIFLTAGDGTLIDQVSYGAGWPLEAGASMELDPSHATFGGNDLAGNWFPAQTVFGMGDKGSPGRPNTGSSGLKGSPTGVTIDLYPNPNRGRFMIEVKFDRPQTGEIRMINLLGQEFTASTFTGQRLIREICEPAFVTPGIWYLEVITGQGSFPVRLVIEE